MPVVVLILSLMLKFSWVLFLIALFASFGARGLYNKGEFAKAKLAAMAAFGASSLLAVLYLTIGILGGGALNLLFAGIWGWFAWRDYKFLQILPKS